jgi:hypothetical protein
MDLSDLIARVEKAEGPDRELDALVWSEFLPRHGEGIDGFDLPDGAHYEYEADDRGAVSMYVRLADGNCRVRARRPAEPFTASIDAAVALAGRVLPGWLFGIETFPNDEVFTPSGAQAFVAEDRSRLDAGYGHGEAKTPAIALVLAILRAVQAQREAA